MPDQRAVVQELYSRIGSLPPEKAAVVSELATRFGIAKPQDKEGFASATLRKTAEKMNIGNVLQNVSEADRLANEGKVIPQGPTFNVKTGERTDGEDTAGSKLNELIPDPI